MNKPEQVGDEQVVYEGRLFEVVETPMNIGEQEIAFEKARRAPGVRLLIVKDGNMLLTNEYRSELGGYDHRLPGGKVFDSLNEYRQALDANTDLSEAAKAAAIKEASEETGCKPTEIEHIHTTSPGATVEWDLYYFLVTNFEHCEIQLEDGEHIEPLWFSFEDVKRMCLDGSIQEDRTVAVLLKYLLQ